MMNSPSPRTPSVPRPLNPASHPRECSARICPTSSRNWRIVSADSSDSGFLSGGWRGSSGSGNSSVWRVSRTNSRGKNSAQRHVLNEKLASSIRDLMLRHSSRNFLVFQVGASSPLPLGVVLLLFVATYPCEDVPASGTSLMTSSMFMAVL